MMSSLMRACRRAALILLMFSAIAAADEMRRIHLGSKASEVLMMKITVSDLPQSMNFYTNVLGLKEVDMPGLPKTAIDDPDADIIQVMMNFSGSAADGILCLLKQKRITPTPEAVKLAWVGIKVADTRAVIARAKAAGVKVDLESTDFKGVLLGMIHDPDGYMIELMQGESVKTKKTPGIPR
jgi:predicted enzyme related to lactoylglutathione lyase